MQNLYDNFNLDLTTCDKEPIHIPNFVQEYGYLFSLSIETKNLSNVCIDFDELIDIDIANDLGKNYKDVIKDKSLLNLIDNVIDLDMEINKLYHKNIDFENVTYDVIVHKSFSEYIFEIIDTRVFNNKKYLSGNAILNKVNDIFTNTKTLKELVSQIPIVIKDITGFDRVMVYEFDKDYHGEVKAEAKEKNLESFLNLHFPASDIPVQARALYKLNTVRLIPDINYKPILVKGEEKKDRLDMSYCVTRSVSPIHIEYLRNMGVGASMSLSIICNGELWGLIACHHMSEKYIPLELWNVFILIAELISANINSRVEYEKQERVLQQNSKLTLYLQLLAQNSSLYSNKLALSSTLKELYELYMADDFGIYYNDGSVYSQLYNNIVDNNKFEKLSKWLLENIKEDYLITDNFFSYDGVDEFFTHSMSGLIYIKISTNPDIILVWLRKEYINQVTWAGNPNKPATQTNEGIRLSPRLSFDAWSELVYFKSQPFDEITIKNQIKFFAKQVKELISKNKDNNIKQLQLSTPAGKISKLIYKKNEIFQNNNIKDKFYTASKMAKLGSWEYDVNTQKVWWSDELKNMFNKSNEDINLYSIVDVCIEQDKEKLKSIINKALSSNESKEIVFDIKDKEQIKKIWMKLDVEIKDDNIKKLHGIIQDLTHFIDIQREIDLVQNRIEKVISSSLYCIYIFDFKQKRLTFVNDKFQEVSGYGIDELNNIIKDDEYIVFHPEDRQKIFDHHNQLKKTKDGNKVKNIRFRLSSSSGKWIWCHSMDMVFEFDEDNEPKNMLGNFIDISKEMENELALRSSLARLQAIFDNSGLGIQLLDGDGKIISHNRWLSKILNVELNEMHNKTLYDFIDKKYVQKLSEYFAELYEYKRSSFQVRICFRKSDGNEVWGVLYVSTADTLENERVVIAIIQDITKEVKLELSKKEQDRILVQQNKLAAMGEMIGAIAHQWRQPLSVISGTLINIEETYEYEELTPEYLSEQITYAEKNLAYMSKTIDDFRNFFAPSKGKILFSIQKSIINAVKIFEAQIKNHNIKLEFIFNKDDDSYSLTKFDDINLLRWHDFVNGFENEFMQVFINIISNAKDAIIESVEKRIIEKDDGEIKVYVNSYENQVIIEISDNGVGISNEIIDRVYEPYFTTKEQGKGTGIGLYMSKMIIEDNMGGSLKIDNNENTKFIITLNKQRKE